MIVDGVFSFIVSSAVSLEKSPMLVIKRELSLCMTFPRPRSSCPEKRGGIHVVKADGTRGAWVQLRRSPRSLGVLKHYPACVVTQRRLHARFPGLYWPTKSFCYGMPINIPGHSMETSGLLY